MNNIGEIIRGKRKEKGYSLRQLGEKMNINFSHISKLETGKKKPNLEMLEALARSLDCKVSDFFDQGEQQNELFTDDEKELFIALDLDDKEALDKIDIRFGGKKVSKQELSFMLQTLKNLRETMGK